MVIDIRHESSIGDRIRAAREHAQLSVADLARSAGLSPEELAAIEAGGPLTTMVLDAIARTLGIGVLSLLDDSPIREVFGRIGNASATEVDDALGLLTQFVRDYEFLCSLEE